MCVVGDDDQSIYSWRGADISIIYSIFQILLENASYYQVGTKLPIYTKIFWMRAWAVVSRNSCSIWKEIMDRQWNQGDKIIYPGSDRDERDEIYGKSWIIYLGKEWYRRSESILEWNGDSIPYQCSEQGVRRYILSVNGGYTNYQIIGGIKFYERKEIKDILAYLRLIREPIMTDSISFDRIINFPARGIGKTSIGEIYMDWQISEIHVHISLYYQS